MMLTHCPGSSPIPTRPEATRATSSPKLRAVTSTQERPSAALRSMIVESGSRAIRSASSHGTVHERSGSVTTSLVAAPSSTRGLPAADTVGWPGDGRGFTWSLCQVGRCERSLRPKDLTACLSEIR